MPAMDLALIQSLGRDLHSHSPGYMGEDEVCPWTLFLTMALTLLKGHFISYMGPSGSVVGPFRDNWGSRGFLGVICIPTIPDTWERTKFVHGPYF